MIFNEIRIMKIQPVKGTRDFYPEQMARRNFIVDGWRKASLRSGFEEYDGPIFEQLKMYQVKSGDEIVEQLFNLTDRGGRDLAIRPEITPTLARMVNQKINSLPRPIKWFSVPRLCRAERPQKGRLREFFQWNIDIIGIEDSRADAEVIFTTVDYLRCVGLSAEDVRAKISSRKLLAAVLVSIGIEKEKLESLYPLLDKKAKLTDEAFAEALAEKVPDAKTAAKIIEFMSLNSIDKIESAVDLNSDAKSALEELAAVFEMLDLMGVGDFCVFDPGIVRGLAYYTGVVFEVQETAGDLRALCGGGRYDNLLRDFGGPSLGATGMGMGDCVLEILLEQKGLLSENVAGISLDYFLAWLDKDVEKQAIELVAKLRTAGLAADMGYKAAKLGKQLKAASQSNATECIIMGDEFIEKKELIIKDLARGEQRAVGIDEFLATIESSTK